MTSTKLHVYSKPDCCLCDAALEPVTVVAREAGLEVVKVNIADDPDLLERHGQRIPVVELDGEPMFTYGVDEDDLRAAVAARVATEPHG